MGSGKLGAWLHVLSSSPTPVLLYFLSGATTLQTSKMSPRNEEDDGGPTDEEGSTSSSEIIQQTPSNIEQPAADDDDSSVEVNVHNPATDDGRKDNPEDSDGLEEPPAAKEQEQTNSEEASPTRHILEQRETPVTPVTSGYVSFRGDPKSTATKIFKHEDDTQEDEDSLSRPKSRIAPKATTTRQQVLVHYHPQLGDEGFESTLVPDTNMVEPTTPSSRGRPMDESPYYSGGAAGMNSRMMEDVRDGRAYNNYHNSPPTSPMNDEQNNAATRQIRRRVFRAALERGIHDERRKKMLDADADIGGPSVRGGGATSYYKRPPAGGMNSRSRDADDEDIPMSPKAPKLYEATTASAIGNFSPTATKRQQTISPPAPPAAPPSYRTIIQKLIKDNEPQKLPQLEKVLAKYNGREEELILKLDMRYKKMKQKAGAAILQDLEKSETVKEEVVSPARSGGGESRNSQKSKDVYFVKVSKAPLPGAMKLPSDIIDSNKTAPQSNVSKDLPIEDEGDIPAIPKRDAAPVEVAAAAVANEVKKGEIKSPARLQEPYKFKMTPSYGDEISVITMETKETLKKKMTERGEDTYSWLQRPPNSITVEGGGGPNIQEPLSPERKSKINKLLPDFDQEKEEDKAKADDAKLVPIALNDVEARIRARRRIMEEEAKKKTDSCVDTKKDEGVSTVNDGASIIEDTESFVGKSNSTKPASTQEDEVRLSLIDQQERELSQSNAVKEEPKQMNTTQPALQVGGVDDVDEEEEIDQLLKESRLQAEKAIALKKAQRELEKEKKARMEAEAARIALEEELARLKAEAAGDTKPIASKEATDINSGSDEDDAVDTALEDQAGVSDEPLKCDLNKTFSSVSADNSEQEDAILQDGDLEESQPLEDTDGDFSDGVDIAGDSAESVEGSHNEDGADQESSEDEDLPASKQQDGDGGRDSIAAADEISSTESDGIIEDAVEKAEELSPRDFGDTVSPSPEEDTVAKKLNEEVEQSVAQGATQMSEHDFPSTTMVHASPVQDRISEQMSDVDEDANFNHVATMTFEGNRAKGQLSFITGSKILAHSNQRGPWWLGKCGKQTGWFPANAVVPESEYLKNIAVALPAEMDEASDRLGKLSNEELAATYDLIRNPSDPIDDDDDDDEDDNGSPARSRWMNDTSNDNTAQSARSGSPPPSRSDPSKMEGLNQTLYEPNKFDVVESTPQLGFEGMNRLGKSIEEHSEDKPKKTYIGPPQVITETEPPKTESPKIIQTKAGSKSKKKKKKPQEWKAAQDPGTGLTYYYHLKTREVSCSFF